MLDIEKGSPEWVSLKKKLRRVSNKLKDKYPKICCAVKMIKKSICKNGCVPGANRCKFHGGASLRGPQCPAYKTGQYSQHKKNILEAIEKWKKDPKLRDLTNELAMLKALLEAVIVQKDDLVSISSQEEITSLIRNIAHITDVMKKVNEGYTLNHKNVTNILFQVVTIVRNRVKDAGERQLIAGDLRSLHMTAEQTQS